MFKSLAISYPDIQNLAYEGYVQGNI